MGYKGKVGEMLNKNLQLHSKGQSAYTIIVKWPEREGVTLIENERGGRKETRGLWAWRLDAINPGGMTEISFAVSGLSHEIGKKRRSSSAVMGK